MAHVEPDGLPVDTLTPALCDALTDVSTELVDGLHTAHGSLRDHGHMHARIAAGAAKASLRAAGYTVRGRVSR